MSDIAQLRREQEELARKRREIEERLARAASRPAAAPAAQQPAPASPYSSGGAMPRNPYQHYQSPSSNYQTPPGRPASTGGVASYPQQPARPASAGYPAQHGGYPAQHPPGGYPQNRYSGGGAPQQHQPHSSAYSSAPATPAQPALPPGWDMRRTAEGRPYYVHHATRTTQWHPPQPAAQQIPQHHSMSSLPRQSDPPSMNRVGGMSTPNVQRGGSGKLTAQDMDDSIVITDVEVQKKVGHGAFGVVYKGMWQDAIDVALKQVTKDDDEGIDEFVGEVQMLLNLRHPNVIRFYGIYKTTTKAREEAMYMVLEWANAGALLDYLKKHDLSDGQLISMAVDAARGMMYLSERNPPVVHRDLALRNLLVSVEGAKHTVKVGDFGLSRFTAAEDDDAMYCSQDNKKPLPVRWLAPEAWYERTFSVKSDVWAFAVTLWELFTTGSIPYDDLNERQVMKEVAKGRRLKQPLACPDAVWKIMGSCWTETPADRPTFRQLYDQLREFFKTMGSGSLETPEMRSGQFLTPSPRVDQFASDDDSLPSFDVDTGGGGDYLAPDGSDGDYLAPDDGGGYIQPGSPGRGDDAFAGSEYVARPCVNVAPHDGSYVAPDEDELAAGAVVSGYVVPGGDKRASASLTSAAAATAYVAPEAEDDEDKPKAGNDAGAPDANPRKWIGVRRTATSQTIGRSRGAQAEAEAIEQRSPARAGTMPHSRPSRSPPRTSMDMAEEMRLRTAAAPQPPPPAAASTPVQRTPVHSAAPAPRPVSLPGGIEAVSRPPETSWSHRPASAAGIAVSALPPVTGFVRKMDKTDTRKSSVVALLVDTFANEVCQYSHCSSKEEKRRKLMTHYFFDAEVACALASRIVYGVEDKEKILGVSFWCAPGQSYTSIQGLLKYTQPIPMTQYSPKNMVLLVKNATSMSSIASKYRDHYILFQMAVHPSVQRCGIGTKMLMPVLTDAEQAKASCMAMVLTPSAVPFLKRFGFHVEEERSLNFGLKLIVMVRLPGAAATE